MTRLILFHPMDVRGRKVGGIETHVRLILQELPSSESVLLVGVDEVGGCELGRVHQIVYGNRTIDFLPVMRVDASAVNTAARRITRSLTLRFLRAALRHLPTIAGIVRGEDVSCEIERFEFALLPRLIGRPFVLVVHNDGSRGDAMDSLLKRYWFLHLANERIALALAAKIFAVNASIAERIAKLSRHAAARTDVLSVSVDTRRFSPTPFETVGSTFRVCYAGRLDAFKDPPLMFASLALAAERMAARPGRFARLAFDYVGAHDPTLVPGFGRIAALTTRHGVKTSTEVAAIMRGAHAGIVTSFFEGMPCYLLEMLASGRPVAAIDLPQFGPLIEAGRSGRRVVRGTDPAVAAGAMADALLALADEIADGTLDPVSIAAGVRPYSVDAQMGRLFAAHASLTARGGQPSESASAA